MPRQSEARDAIESEYAIFNTIIRHLWTLNGEAQMKELSRASAVSTATLYLWKSGVTTRPRIDTLTKVARAMGYSIELKRRRRPSLRTV